MSDPQSTTHSTTELSQQHTTKIHSEKQATPADGVDNSPQEPHQPYFDQTKAILDSEIQRLLEEKDVPNIRDLQADNWEPEAPKSIDGHLLLKSPGVGMNCLIHSVLRAYKAYGGKYKIEAISDMSQHTRNHLVETGKVQEGMMLQGPQAIKVIEFLREKRYIDGRALQCHQYTNQQRTKTVSPYLTSFEYIDAASERDKALPPIRIFYSTKSQHYSAMVPQERIPSEANTNSHLLTLCCMLPICYMPTCPQNLQVSKRLIAETTQC